VLRPEAGDVRRTEQAHRPAELVDQQVQDRGDAALPADSSFVSPSRIAGTTTTATRSRFSVGWSDAIATLMMPMPAPASL
jgi:hypothetical protein